MTSCTQIETSLIAELRGDLKSLERERVRAHLAHCAGCNSLHEALSSGLDAARRWDPEPVPSELDILNQRLRPFMETRRRPGRWWVAPVALAALGAAGVAVILTVTPKADSLAPQTGVATAEPLVTAAEPGAPIEPVTPTETRAGASQQVVRSTPTPFVFVVASDTWDGRVEANGGDVSVTMARGFAVFAFKGGRGRKLRVSAPDALVEVVGTRFSVEVRDGATRVLVGDGRVRVMTLQGTRLLVPGESMVAGDGRGDWRADAYLDDPHLVRLDAHGAKRRGGRKHAAVGGADTTDLFEQLARAEDLAQAGQLDAAISAYRQVASTAAHPTYSELAEYEIARIIGFKQGHADQARSILRKLAQRGRSEAKRQATLALCELDLDERPCRAARCLHELASGVDYQLAREAKGLLKHWALAACDDSGPGAPSSNAEASDLH